MKTSHPPPRTTQRGMSLWDTLLLLGAVAGLLVAGFVLNESSGALRRADDNRAFLDWADHRLLAFAATRGRLPCPDTDGDGLENCAAGAQKGWLPLATLALGADAPLTGPIRLRYAVYRQGGTLDQATGPANDFEPLADDGGNLTAARSLGNTSGVDFCFRLSAAIHATPTTAAAHVLTGGAPANVAYALAASGAGRGVAGSFGGANAEDTPAMELPSRTPDGGYGDTVLVRTLPELSDALGCAAAMASLNAMSLIVEAVAEVDDMKTWTTLSAAINAAMSGVKMGVALIKAALSGYLIASASATLATASAELTAAIASCAILVGCALIPTAAAAVASATAAIVSGSTALALNTASIVPMTVALGLGIAAAVRAGAEVAATGIDLSDSLADIAAERDRAWTEAHAARFEAQQAREQATLARPAVDERYDALFQIADDANGEDPLSDSDRALIEDAATKARALVEAELQQGIAEGNYDSAREKYDAKLIEVEKARIEVAADPSNTAKADRLAEMEAELLDAEHARDAAYAEMLAKRDQTTTARNAYSEAASAAEDAFVGLSDGIDKYYRAYRDWRGLDYVAAERESLADAKEEAARRMDEVYDQIANSIANPDNGTSGGGTPVWAGAAGVLEAADQRGTGQLVTP